MKPFFSYYGAKFTLAKYVGPPRRDFVIEPFAGSAAYSTLYEPFRVALYDVNVDICDLWHWLIHCSDSDVLSIPDRFDDFEQVNRLSRGSNLLVRFWIGKGFAEPANRLSPWYLQFRGCNNCKVWGPAVKARILRQKPMIKQWTIDQMSYHKIPLREAHWHVDPPYSNRAGRRYKYSAIDYDNLAEWCSSLPGSVDVFENAGADWLPFQHLRDIHTTRGKRSGAVSREMIARFDNPATANAVAMQRHRP